MERGLNQAGVEASSTFRRAESVYYHPTISALGSTSSKADIALEVAELGKDSLAQVPLSFNSPSKEAEQPEVVE